MHSISTVFGDRVGRGGFSVVTENLRDPSRRVAAEIWGSIDVVKTQLESIREAGTNGDQSTSFDAINRELERLSFHVRQLLAPVTRNEPLLNGLTHEDPTSPLP
jgi:hypothetical protein